MKPQPVSFLSQNNRKKSASFIKFHVKLATHTKKEGFYIKLSVVSRQFHWNWPETQKTAKVSMKLGAKNMSLLAWNQLKAQFHNYMPHKIMKASASFIFEAKKSESNTSQFHPVSRDNWRQKKGGFYWNLTVLHKTGQ